MIQRMKISYSQKNLKIVRKKNKTFEQVNNGNIDYEYNTINRNHLLDLIEGDREKLEDQFQAIPKINYNDYNNFQIGDQPKSKFGMKTLILDLDETLVHASFTPSNPDYILNLEINRLI